MSDMSTTAIQAVLRCLHQKSSISGKSCCEECYNLFWYAYSQNINFWERSRGELQHYRLILHVNIENLCRGLGRLTGFCNPVSQELLVGTAALLTDFECLYQKSIFSYLKHYSTTSRFETHQSENQQFGRGLGGHYSTTGSFRTSLQKI